MKKIINNILSFLVFSLLYLLILPLLVSNLLGSIGLDQELSLSLSMFLSVLVLVIIIYFIYKDELNSHLKKITKKDFFYSLKMFGLMLVISMVFNIIGFNLLGNVSDNETVARELIGNSILIMGLTTAIIVPILEELINRFILRKAFKNDTIFIVISALIFGLLHMGSGINNIGQFFQFLSYASIGVFLSYAYVKTNNAFVPILMHIFNNSLTIFVVFILTPLLTKVI